MDRFKNNFRQATPEEIEFYEAFLYPFQDEIFQCFQTDQFYLSGGTCLSRFYYHHRFSEDLDFFFDGFLFPKDEFEIAVRETINRISEKFKTEITMSGDYFKRGFVYKDEVAMKIEFIFENYRSIGQREKVNNILIDSKENIATNKLTAVYDRKTAKDFFDLYYLLREIDFEQVAAWAELKVVPLDYEGVLIAFADPNLEGIALTKHPTPLQDFENFVKDLIKRMIDYAKKHE